MTFNNNRTTKSPKLICQLASYTLSVFIFVLYIFLIFNNFSKHLKRKTKRVQNQRAVKKSNWGCNLSVVWGSPGPRGRLIGGTLYFTDCLGPSLGLHHISLWLSQWDVGRPLYPANKRIGFTWFHVSGGWSNPPTVRGYQIFFSTIWLVINYFKSSQTFRRTIFDVNLVN